MSRNLGWTPSAMTTVAGVIGNPVRHSRSPAIHNAAFAALDLDWVYVAWEADADAAPAAVESMRALRLGGLSVTMPAKQAVAAAVDRRTADVESLGAANCVRWDGDELVGENTDGDGFVRSLRADAGFDPAGRRCVVVGAGGAARSIVLALARSGPADLAVLNRTAAAAESAAELAGPVGRLAASADVRDADLIVNATSLGMSPDDPLPIASESLRPGQLIADIVYRRGTTPLLVAATAVGADVLGGLGMLVQQAAIAFEHWTGHEAPVAAMTEAVLAP
ncbi:MAG: shikimate dehydrogenase [Actinomycetota bacterium]